MKRCLLLAVFLCFLCACQSQPPRTPQELVDALSGAESAQAYRQLQVSSDAGTMPALLKGLHSKSAITRKFCVRLLARRSESDGVEAIEQGLKDSNSSVVQEAARALKEFYSDEELIAKASLPGLSNESRLALLSEVEDKSLARKPFRAWLADRAQAESVRVMAAGQSDEVALLLKVAGDKGEPASVRCAALANGAVREKVAVETAWAWISDERENVRVRATATLLLRDDARLLSLVEDASMPELVRKAAKLALGGAREIHLGTRERGCCDIKAFSPGEPVLVHFRPFRARTGQTWKVVLSGPGGFSREVSRDVRVAEERVTIKAEPPGGGWPTGKYAAVLYTDERAQEPGLSFEVSR